MSSRNGSSALILAAFLLAASTGLGGASPEAWNPLPAIYTDAELAALRGPSGPDPALQGVAPEPAMRSAGAGRAENGEAKPERRSKKALLLSLLLPGAGELYMGHKGRATGFFVSEGAIWAHYIGWEIAGHLRKDNYIEQAQTNAGVGTGDEDDEYWRLVGQYERSSGSGPGSYEEDLRREAREQYPTDPAAQDGYVAERLPVGTRAWTWESEPLRTQYRATREDANRAFNRAELSFAFAVLNRIASAIDTQILHARSSRGNSSSRLDGGGIHLRAGMTPYGDGRVALHSRF